nr:RNA chaperone Hfq [Clostridium frigoris]
MQDIFLNDARKNKIQVTLYLINGFQLKGNVTGFDTFTVVLNCDGKQMMVYKHAISTITPLKPILLGSEES